ncbi:hypothetical protein ACLKA7_015421 [Drosophila subpalustris]
MEVNTDKQENLLDSLEAMPNGALKQLLLWHNWPKTALFFFVILMVLLDIASNSIISVISVAGVLILLISICYCCYVWGMRKLRKSNTVDHPYQSYLETDLSISEESAAHLARLVVVKLNPILLKLRSLFLIEDLLDSLKLLVTLCGLNVVGDYINGMTLLVLGFILVFTLPKLYEWKKPMIDMQLKHLQRLKNRLFCSKKKTHSSAPTATVDPQVISSKLRPKSNGIDSENQHNTGQFISTDQEYVWQQQEMPHEDYMHYKDQ